MTRNSHGLVTQAAIVLAGALSICGLANAQGGSPKPPALEPWYEAFELSGFVDAYAGANFRRSPLVGNNRFRVADRSNGFAFSWAGVDVRVAPDPVGGELNLRFGPTARVLCGGRASEDCHQGLENLTQAFGSWRPDGADGAVTLDFGKFRTPFGAEVAESQDNFNYTRGLLYVLTTPRFHTGLRVRADLSPAWALSALLVNGWNNSLDDNSAKSLGVQATVAFSPQLTLRVGWMGGPEEDGSSAPWRDVLAWRHLADTVVCLQPVETLSLLLGASWISEEVSSGWAGTYGDSDVEYARTYGVSVGARQSVTPVWNLAARGEALRDPQGGRSDIRGLWLASGTLTVEAVPAEGLSLRLEHRGDFALSANASPQVFHTRAGPQSYQLTSTLGVVVSTN